MTIWRDECTVKVVGHEGKGGQHVGSAPAGVRVLHEPTGLVAECGYERSQLKNREVAFSMIEWGLVAMKLPLKREGPRNGKDIADEIWALGEK
jgi:protein subunit release factor A